MGFYRVLLWCTSSLYISTYESRTCFTDLSSRDLAELLHRKVYQEFTENQALRGNFSISIAPLQEYQGQDEIYIPQELIQKYKEIRKRLRERNSNERKISNRKNWVESS